MSYHSNHDRRQFLATTGVGLAASALALPAFAQNKPAAKARPAAEAPVGPWPTKPIRLIVPWPAGTSADILGRTVAEPLAKRLGQPVVVDNKPGAGANIGTDMLAKATDNHTIGLISTGPLTTAKYLNPKLSFDPLKDFKPITLVGTAPWVLVVNNSVPTTSPEAMWTHLRNLGNKGNYGSVGIGSAGHLSMELLMSKTGITATHIPYQGNPAIITAMISGDIQLAMMAPAIAMPQARAGKIKAVAVSSAGKSPLITELPTVAELGIRNFEFEAWNAMMAPSSMPNALVERIGRELIDIIRSEEMRSKLFTQGWQIAPSTPEGLAYRIRKDNAMMGGVITMRGIKIDG
jgi:tripartite-type tricarboxylate transporter receptor subunit TctC